MAVFVLIPAFNEAKKIGRVLRDMPSEVHGRAVAVVVIDDGSTDGTSLVAEKEGATVLVQPENMGKGAALCRGIEAITGNDVDAVVWMDGDGQHSPESLGDLVCPVIYENVDLVVGSRYLVSFHQRKAPLNRRLVRKATIGAVQKITGFKVTDPFSGFRAFSRSAFETTRLEGCGYEAELESCFDVAAAGLAFAEVPIARIYGPDTSKMGARYGALRGRLHVVLGYARTIIGEWRRVNRKRARVPLHV